ncbi:MAG: hypothetical protein A2622_10835 [Bdellovibrionales bacterium RIFCSPHIGHO2_01_FULL_40_29]|nr:MAG: hypothetical protein A2622_10835 [Bdellovibrionales bacterium RIFCSPHIGHO2_01_FULL_40_29]OFZ34451.1 MAG: hypothetical protein A3D17_01100 [Bdellovibrionales bacterium RIFCSPHIGHO2_02_FULL_40_15]
MIQTMDKAIKELHPLIRQMEWENPSVYATWLSQIHHIVKTSVPYLGLTVYHSVNYPDFQKRCYEHIREELNHEKLIEADLKNLGIPMSRELPSTMLIYQPQHYQITMKNPLNFLGYIFFLELLAPAYCPEIMERVPNKKAISFLKLHGNEDEGHIKSAQQVLATLPTEIQQMVLSNFHMTQIAYREMLQEILIASRCQIEAPHKAAA